MRILVVDDERLLVKGIKFNLESEGYQVDGAYTGTMTEINPDSDYAKAMVELK